MFDHLSKRLSIREMNWRKNTNPAKLGTIVGVPSEEPDKRNVVNGIPGLVSARSLHSFELTRLTNDPIFGQINRAKIVNADRIIRDNRMKEDPNY